MSSTLGRPAAQDNAPLILVMQPPFRRPDAQPEDGRIARDLVSVGQLPSIELLDQVLIGSGSRFVSLNEQRQGFG